MSVKIWIFLYTTCVTFCMSSRTSASEHLKDEDSVMWGKELCAPFQPTLYLDFCQNKLSCCCKSPTLSDKC